MAIESKNAFILGLSEVILNGKYALLSIYTEKNALFSSIQVWVFHKKFYMMAIPCI